MRIEVSVPEVVKVFKEIQNQPQKIFEMVRLEVQEIVGRYLTEMMNAELTHFLGREPYERKEETDNYRNGSYKRDFTLKGIGEVSVKVPRDRNGEYRTQVIPRSRQYEDEIGKDLCVLFLGGASTRTLSILSQRLIGRKLSHTEISSANKELIDAVEGWRNRDLSDEPIKYLFVDGVNFDMRMGDSIENISVLVAIGVTESGKRLVVGLQAGDKESASNWREFFKDLKARGLDSGKVSLGIMDGLPGLEKVFKEEFPNAKVQAQHPSHVSWNPLPAWASALSQTCVTHKKDLPMASETLRNPHTDQLLTPENSALIIIDYQPVQVSSIRSMPREELVFNITSIAKAAVNYNVPIIHSTVNVATGRNKPPIQALQEVLGHLPTYDRTSINSWEDTEFKQAVKALGRKKLIMTALWTEACLTFPVLDAIQEGYEVYVPVDAVGGTSLAAHEAALRRMEQAGAKLISRVQMYCELQRDWAREVTVPGFMGVFENFDGFNAEKALEEAGKKA